MIDESLGRGINDAALLSGSFLLRSGQTSNEYFDKYRFESDPKLLRRIAVELAKLVPAETEILAGLELGGIPIVTALGQITGLRCGFIRKEAKTYGTCRAVEGVDVAGKKVLLVEDIITTGGAVAQAADHLRNEAAELVGVLCVIWRGEGEPHIAKIPDLPVYPLATKDELASA